MDRITHATAVDIGGGRRGFRSKDTVAGIRGTVVTAGHMNATQEEMVGLIEKSGLAPAAADLTQLAKAMRSQRLNYIAAVSGTASAIGINLDPAPASWAELVGVPLRLLMPWAATGAANISVVGLAGSRTLVAAGGFQILGEQWLVGQIVEVIYDGTNVQLSAARRGTLLNVQVFATPGVFTYTPVAGTRQIEIEICAGGGGGAGARATAVSQTSVGAGGGAGGYSRGIASTGFAGATVTVGAGGAAGLGAGAGAGGNGGASSFGSLLSAAGGGGGGVLGPSGAPLYAVGGSGGAGAGGFINSGGNSGMTHVAYSNNNAFDGHGGASYFGAGGYRGGTGGNGSAGAAPGSGGGGSVVAENTAVARNGGAGAPGIVIIREFA